MHARPVLLPGTSAIHDRYGDTCDHTFDVKLDGGLDGTFAGTFGCVGVVDIGDGDPGGRDGADGAGREWAGLL